MPRPNFIKPLPDCRSDAVREDQGPLPLAVYFSNVLKKNEDGLCIVKPTNKATTNRNMVLLFSIVYLLSYTFFSLY